METLVGIFKSRRTATDAVNGLRAIGLGNESITFVTPEHPEEGLASVPTTDAEPARMGPVIGGVVGGSIGLGAGSAIASLFVPGVGPVLAVGVAAAAILGVGAAIGAAIGEATEQALNEGIPRDDIPFYHELLRQDRSLVVALLDTNELAVAARAVLQKHGAQDVDAAREQWESGGSEHAA